MKIIKSDLEAIAVKPEGYPDIDIPEIAFAGRSNVGKSSFINAMLQRRNLARTSSTPGKTRTLNFYRINDDFRFVDLPGYGYAKVNKAEKAKWGPMIENYLASRENLIEVFLLVDIRHEPTKDDKMMYEWILHYGFQGYVIATKEDKVSGNGRAKAMKTISKALDIQDRSKILTFSSQTRSRVDKTWALIEELLMPLEEIETL